MGGCNQKGVLALICNCSIEFAFRSTRNEMYVMHLCEYIYLCIYICLCIGTDFVFFCDLLVLRINIFVCVCVYIWRKIASFVCVCVFCFCLGGFGIWFLVFLLNVHFNRIWCSLFCCVCMFVCWRLPICFRLCCSIRSTTTKLQTKIRGHYL